MEILTIFFIFSISFITTFLITPTIRYAGLKFYAIDKRGQRKIHTKVITKLGGIAIYCGFISGLIIFTILDFNLLNKSLITLAGLVLCSTLMLILGVYDDFQNSRPIKKLLMQIIIALLLVRVGFVLDRVLLPGIIDIKLDKLAVPISVIWLVGISNAINLTDGLDGLAAGIVAIISLFFCFQAFIFQDHFILYISLSLMGASMAFLRYNFYPSKIFMGDTGSLFLGFIVGSIAIYNPHVRTNLTNPYFIPALITLTLPIIDVIFSIARRVLRKQNIFIGDFCHIHHYYIKLGFTQAQTAIRFYIMTFFLGSVSLIITYLYFVQSTKLHFYKI